MSRIYDALRQSGIDQTAELAQLIDELHVHASPSGDSLGVVEQRDWAGAPEVGDSVNIAGGNLRTVSVRIAAGAPLFPFEDGQGRAAEQYRILRTHLLHHERKPTVIGVSSATSGDGKTITAINLAGTLALKTNATVVLVDADLRSRQVSELLGIDAAPGLSEVLRQESYLDEALLEVEQIPGLYLLTAGARADHPTEMLDSELFTRLIAELRERFSFVVLDTTPLGIVADSRLVQELTDGMILVIRPDHTNRAALKAALVNPDRLRLLGTVLNGVDDWFLWRAGEKQNENRYVKRSRSRLGWLKR